MGTNTLKTVSGGIIDPANHNQYKIALADNVVPRNISGSPTNKAGGLGTSILRWATSYIEKIFFGTPSNENYVGEDGSGRLELSSKHGIKFKINGQIIDGSIGEDGIDKNMLIPYDLKQSTTPLATKSDTTFSDTGLEVTIESHGRPVLLRCQAIEGQSSTIWLQRNSATGVPSGEFRIMRDSTVLCDLPVSYSSASFPGTTLNFVSIPLSFINYIDTPPSGSYTYKVQFKSSTNSANDFVKMFNAKLIGLEI